MVRWVLVDDEATSYMGDVDGETGEAVHLSSDLEHDT